MINTEAYSAIKKELDLATVKLVAVSKFKSADEIQELYNSGQRAFAENYVQELIEKYEKLPKDIEWHFIGHLQGNKVKYITPFINTIQSVDSLKLLKEIDKQAAKSNRVISCLLQIHVAKEETKFGLSFDEAWQILFNEELKGLQRIKIAGVMAMASLTEDEAQIRNEFRSVKHFVDDVNEKGTQLTTISMGMSSDYKIAIEEGATMVRIGTLIFGERN